MPLTTFGITSPFRPPLPHPTISPWIEKAHGVLSYMNPAMDSLDPSFADMPKSDNTITPDDVRRGYADSVVNNFLKGTSDLRMYQDPTYLGFRLMFDWENSPLLKGLRDSDTYRVSSEDNYGQTRFKFQLDTAASYLERLEPGKLGYLLEFGKRLEFTNQYMPWYWQTIDGLQRAYEAYQDFSDPYRGGDDAVITIDTLENVEFGSTGLSELYSRAAHDYDYTRELLPDNLVKFDVYIFVQDIRVLKQGAGNTNTKQRYINLDNTHFIFKFMGCEFQPKTDSKIFGNVSNIMPETAASSLTFSYHDVLVTSTYPWLNMDLDDKWKETYLRTSDNNEIYRHDTYKASDNSNTSFEDSVSKNTLGGMIKGTLQKIGKDALSRLKNAPGDIANRVIDNYTSLALSRMQAMINKNIPNMLGNVYYGSGWSILADPEGYIADQITRLIDESTGMHGPAPINIMSSPGHVPLAGQGDGGSYKDLESIDIMKPNDTDNHGELRTSNTFDKPVPKLIDEPGENILGDKPVRSEDLKTTDILGEPKVSGDRSAGKNVDIKTPNKTDTYRLVDNINVYKFNS